MSTRRLPGPFLLESGHHLPHVDVACRTWGRLDSTGSNAVLVCHALTGSADLESWWPGLLGPGHAFDPDRDFVVCSNVLGGCHGTTGPTSLDPRSGAPYGPDFPAVTIRDLVAVQRRLADALGIRRIRLVVGGSLGGMQALEWALLDPRVQAVAALATSGRHSAWCIGISEAQRSALRADPAFRDGRYAPQRPPRAGLAAARQIAMLSYRSREGLEARFGREQTAGRFAVQDWLAHHGAALVARFDANSYLTLTRAMDSHDVARGRGEYADVLRGLRRPALLLAIESDVLYPPAEQEELAALLPDARLRRLASPHGHDAFLIEAAAVDAALLEFREELSARERLRVAS